MLKETMMQLVNTFEEIHLALGGEDQENWTKETILNRIAELQANQSNEPISVLFIFGVCYSLCYNTNKK